MEALTDAVKPLACGAERLFILDTVASSRNWDSVLVPVEVYQASSVYWGGMHSLGPLARFCGGAATAAAVGPRRCGRCRHPRRASTQSKSMARHYRIPGLHQRRPAPDSGSYGSTGSLVELIRRPAAAIVPGLHGDEAQPRRRNADKALGRFKDRVRDLLWRRRGAACRR
jgi:hypothetical protein